MLSAMFSGKYTAVRDKDGRFFIDADGSNFIYILNYLRYGDLPPANLAETVYREAVYFGIHELVRELEKFPSILGKIQRNNFRASFPGYNECLDAILLSVSETQAKSTASEIVVLVYRKEKNKSRGPPEEEYNYNHICVCSSIFQDRKFTADAKLGPWKSKVTEREVMNCLLYDLQTQGFIVTMSNIGECDYKLTDAHSCHKQFFQLTFYWWKNVD